LHQYRKISAISDIKTGPLYLFWRKSIVGLIASYFYIRLDEIITLKSIPILSVYMDTDIRHSNIQMSDIRYWEKVYLTSDKMLNDILGNLVLYRGFSYQAHSSIVHHGYQTECPPVAKGVPGDVRIQHFRPPGKGKRQYKRENKTRCQYIQKGRKFRPKGVST
jgi:hypothetical protein